MDYFAGQPKVYTYSGSKIPKNWEVDYYNMFIKKIPVKVFFTQDTILFQPLPYQLVRYPWVREPTNLMTKTLGLRFRVGRQHLAGVRILYLALEVQI